MSAADMNQFVHQFRPAPAIHQHISKRSDRFIALDTVHVAQSPYIYTCTGHTRSVSYFKAVHGAINNAQLGIVMLGLKRLVTDRNPWVRKTVAGGLTKVYE